MLHIICNVFCYACLVQCVEIFLQGHQFQLLQSALKGPLKNVIGKIKRSKHNRINRYTSARGMIRKCVVAMIDLSWLL